jgi:hypothetical protein
MRTSSTLSRRRMDSAAGEVTDQYAFGDFEPGARNAGQISGFQHGIGLLAHRQGRGHARGQPCQRGVTWRNLTGKTRIERKQR